MLAFLLLPHSLLLPPLPASGDRDGLCASHAVSDSSHWVVPGLLLQGDGSPQTKGEAFEVGVLADMDTLSAAVDAIEQRVRAGEAIYVNGDYEAQQTAGKLDWVLHLASLPSAEKRTKRKMRK